MTDYFALLDQPRRPWLDSEALKQAFHVKAKQAHPDARSELEQESDALPDAFFAEINEGYQVLLDPKRRIQHLLALHGHSSAPRFEAVPNAIADLFPAVAALTQDLERLAANASKATNALTRSLLAGEALQLRGRSDELLGKLLRLQDEADAELRQISAQCANDADGDVAALHRLCVRYSYLQRWIAGLEEHRHALAGW